MAAAARMPDTEIEAYEDDTRLHFDVLESDLPRFQLTRFFKELTTSPRDCGAAYCCRSNGVFASLTYSERVIRIKC